MLFKGIGTKLDAVAWPTNKFIYIVASVAYLNKRRKIIGKDGYQPN